MDAAIHAGLSHFLQALPGFWGRVLSDSSLDAESPDEIQTLEKSVWLCPGARLVSNDQRTKGSADMGRKQHETLIVYFKGRCNGSGPNSPTLPGLLLCLPSWRFPYKASCCWHVPVCLPRCTYYADSLEGWALLPKGYVPGRSPLSRLGSSLWH